MGYPVTPSPRPGGPQPPGSGHHQRHYGRQAVRRSFRHFALGKGIKMVFTLAALIILARWLETAEYGAYIALRGLIEIGRVITTIGVSGVLYRYLPELRTSGNNVAAYRLLVYGMGLRLAFIGAAFLIALAFIEPLGLSFNLADWLWLIPIALLVGVVDFAATTLSQSLESFMWQKEAQYSLAAGNVLRTLLFVGLVFSGDLTLPNVIYAEGVGMVLTLVLLLWGLWRRWRADNDRSAGDVGWLRDNLRRMLRFGAWSFGLSATAGLYGQGPNRLVIANQLPIGELAVFGFASNLAQFGQRMMPSRLTSTMIRPLMVAKYSDSANVDKLSQIYNLVLRFNLSLLVVPIGILAIAGVPLLDVATDGKYGAAAWLLAGMLVVLITEGTRVLLTLIVQAVEKNQYLAVSNTILSASLLLAFPLIPLVGAWSVVIANFLGTTVANVTLVFLLRRAGFDIRTDWGPVVLIVIYAALPGALVWTTMSTLGWQSLAEPLLATVNFVAAFALLYWFHPPFDRQELDTIKSMVRGRKKQGRQPEGGDA